MGWYDRLSPYDKKIVRGALVLAGILILTAIACTVQFLVNLIGWPGLILLLVAIIVILFCIHRKYGKIVPWKTMYEAEQERKRKEQGNLPDEPLKLGRNPIYFGSEVEELDNSV